VIRLFGETSSGRVGLDITKENLAGTSSMTNRGFTAIGRARSPNLAVDEKGQGCEADRDVFLKAGLIGCKNHCLHQNPGLHGLCR